MALIRATCSDCGDVELRSRDILVRHCVDTDESAYFFRCPVCRMIEARSAEPHVSDVLLAAGCRRETWRLPSELEDARRLDPRVITHDDVLDFHEHLQAASDGQIIMAALPVTSADQARFLEELEHADSNTIARELSS